MVIIFSILKRSDFWLIVSWKFCSLHPLENVHQFMPLPGDEVILSILFPFSVIFIFHYTDIIQLYAKQGQTLGQIFGGCKPIV